MRTLIVGSGPIGTYLAAALSRAGADVTLYGRGAQFDAMAARGSVRVVPDGDVESAVVVPLKCESGVPPPDGWDLLVLAVKAQDVASAAEQFEAHARHAVTLLPQNGLPWWQFLGTPDEALRLATVDPGARAERALALDRIAGCVVTKGLRFDAQGALLEARVASDLFALGDVVVGSGAALGAAQLLGQSGLPVKISDDIRIDKWRKLLINVAFNPLGAISHLGFGEVLDVPEGERLARMLMDEAVAVARACGLEAQIDTEAALARARSSRYHKTSMLQDVEAGRRMEIEPILGVMLELGALKDIRTPTIAAIHACMKLVDHSLAKGPIRHLPPA